MERVTIEAATNDLIHTLGNFFGILRQVRGFHEKGDYRFMTVEEIGAWTLKKEPELSAALDALRGALAVAKIEAEEGLEYDENNGNPYLGEDQ